MSLSKTRIGSLLGRSGCFVIDVPEIKSLTTDFTYNFFEEGEEKISYTSIESGGPSVEKKTEISETIGASYLLSSYIKVNIEFYGGYDVNSTIVNELVDDIQEIEEKILSENDFSGRHFTGFTLQTPDEIVDLKNLTKEAISILNETESGTTQYSNSTTDYIQMYASLKNSGFLFSNVYKQSLPKFFESISNQNLGKIDSSKNINYLNFDFSANFLSPLLKNYFYGFLNNPNSIFSNSVREERSKINSIYNQSIADKNSNDIEPANNYFPSLSSEKVFELKGTNWERENSESDTNVIWSSSQRYDEIIKVGFLASMKIVDFENKVTNIPAKFFKTPESSKDFYITRPPYGAKIVIKVAPVYAVRIPIIKKDNELGYVKTQGVIFVSGNGKKSIIDVVDKKPPLPPQDLLFYVSNNGLEINWSVPFNTQRDITKFRVFRRKDKYEPFTLIHQIDFDKKTDPEVPSYLIEKLPPGEIKTFFTDKTFDQDSSYIYAIASVDAHNLTSDYSEQIHVKINPVFNRLETKLISRIGAYIPYPNMMMEEEIFTDVIKTSGYKSAKVYFNPDFLKVTKENESGAIETLLNLDNNEDSLYKLNLINIDLQKQQNLDIIIGETIQEYSYDSNDNAIIKSFFNA